VRGWLLKILVGEDLTGMSIQTFVSSTDCPLARRWFSYCVYVMVCYAHPWKLCCYYLLPLLLDSRLYLLILT